MSVIDRVRAEWSGSTVTGGGLSTFYFSDADTGKVAAVKSFFEALKTLLPPGTSIQVQPSGDIFESTTGALLGGWSETGVSPTVGTAAPPAYAAGVGARIVWRTLGVVGNRRVTGSTFIVPLGSAAYDVDGTPSAGAINAMENAVAALLNPTGSQPLIWHRPKAGAGGSAHDIISGQIPDKVSWLRTRRT